MSTIVAVLLWWLVPAAVLCFGAVMVFIMEGGRNANRKSQREAARIALLSPLWPVLLPAWIVRGVFTLYRAGWGRR